MTRGVSMNHMQRIILAFREGVQRLERASAKIDADLCLFHQLQQQLDAQTERKTRSGDGGVLPEGSSAPVGNTGPTEESRLEGGYEARDGGDGRRSSGRESRANGQTSWHVDPSGSPPEASFPIPEAVSSLLPYEGYPSPYSVCTVGEVDVLHYLFGQTIHTIQKYSENNYPWQDHALPFGPRCQSSSSSCPHASIFCTLGKVSKMCEPQCCLDPSWMPHPTEAELDELRHLGCLGDTMIPDDHGDAPFGEEEEVRAMEGEGIGGEGEDAIAMGNGEVRERTQRHAGMPSYPSPMGNARGGVDATATMDENGRATKTASVTTTHYSSTSRYEHTSDTQQESSLCHPTFHTHSPTSSSGAASWMEKSQPSYQSPNRHRRGRHSTAHSSTTSSHNEAHERSSYPSSGSEKTNPKPQ